MDVNRSKAKAVEQLINAKCNTSNNPKQLNGAAEQATNGQEWLQTSDKLLSNFSTNEENEHNKNHQYSVQELNASCARYISIELLYDPIQTSPMPYTSNQEH